MFNKKYCKKCRNRVNKTQRFCSECGIQLHNSQEDWGMLGKTDSIEEEFLENPFFGGFSGKILNKMVKNTLRMLEKEMEKEEMNMQSMPRTNFKLMINGKEIKFNEQERLQRKKQVVDMPLDQFKENQLKIFSRLPKEDPKTNLRRFGDKIIYEIEMPETKSVKDVLINKLENSIEIKAIGKTKAYFKIIPINMPIVNKTLFQGKLILELQEN